MAKKGNCPRCGARMKLRHRFCTGCGAGNPLLVAARPRRRGPAVKSAGGGYAPVLPLRPVVPARDPRWAAVLADPDPEARERLFKAHFPDVTKGGAA